jgi:two-component system response regulator AtoC
MAAGKILVVDDDRLIRWSLIQALANGSYEVGEAGSGAACLDAIMGDVPDLILMDVMLGDMNGVDILERLQQEGVRTTVIMMTAHDSIELAVRAMKLGAYDYLPKPLDIPSLLRVVEKALESSRLRSEVERLHTAESSRFGIEKIVARSPQMQKVCDVVRRVAASGASSALIEGESGTGKDLVAGTIHYMSDRANKPFVTINCGALPENLLESDLFGHEKGSFTDAKTSKKGLFEVADGGTVLLDEIGDMQLSAQVKLLHAIENKTFRRVGGTRDISTDIRIMAATNQNLQRYIQEGRFREDLYYRLKVISFRMPAIRERREDIPQLIETFLHEMNAQLNRNVREVDDEAMRLLTEYDWPGNVREMRNVVERAMLLSDAPVIYANSLPHEIRHGLAGVAPDSKETTTYSTAVPPEGLSLSEVERTLIMSAIDRSGNNKTQAAKLLGISRDALRYRLKKLEEEG